MALHAPRVKRSKLIIPHASKMRVVQTNQDSSRRLPHHRCLDAVEPRGSSSQNFHRMTSSRQTNEPVHRSVRFQSTEVPVCHAPCAAPKCRSQRTNSISRHLLERSVKTAPVHWTPDTPHAITEVTTASHPEHVPMPAATASRGQNLRTPCKSLDASCWLVSFFGFSRPNEYQLTSVVLQGFAPLTSP